MRSSEVRRTLAAMAAAAAAVIVGGCAETHQGRNPIMSGFLGDYSQLREGAGDEAQLVYVKPNCDFRAYDKLMLDPIKVVCTPQKSWLAEASKEEVQALVDYFDAAIRKSLGDDVAFVDAPGPGVLRLRLALTDASGAAVVRDVVSSVVPQMLAISALKSLILNKATGVGEASVEAELVDSVSGERLVAAVDKRIGSKFTGRFDKFDQWRAPKAAFDYWAMRMKLRMIELRGRPAAE